MMRAPAGFACGLLFGLGLVLSGMTQPAKVKGFLDVTGNWDPSLAFVMGGAILVFAPLYRYIIRHSQPVFASRFVVYRGRQLDARLIVGSLMFGLGWGISGYCPGPALVAMGGGAAESLVFAISMLAGMLLFQAYERTLEPTPAARESERPHGTITDG